MKTKLSIIFIAFLSINLVAFAQMQDPPEYPHIELSSEKLIELEKKLIKVEGTKEAKNLMKDIEVEANKNLFLYVNGKVHSASAIFACQRLKVNFQCSLSAEDEIAEVLQNATYKRVSGKIKNAKAFLNPEYTTTRYQFYLTDGAKTTKPLPISIDNTLKTKLTGKKEKVIFAIVKGENELFYKKYVWVFQP